MESTTDKLAEIFEDLDRRNPFIVTKKIAAYEIDIHEDGYDKRIAENRQIPAYRKIGTKTNSKFIINLLDIACYLASVQLTKWERRQFIREYLQCKYKKSILSKKDFADFLGVCTNTLTAYQKTNLVPIPRRDGNAKNAKITYDIGSIADFLIDTIEIN